jgi:hypothetical protein
MVAFTGRLAQTAAVGGHATRDDWPAERCSCYGSGDNAGSST